MTYAAHAVQPTQPQPTPQAFEPIRITGTVKYEARKSWNVRGHAAPRSNVVLRTSEGDIQAWGDFDAISHLRKGNPVTAELDREGKSWSIVLPSQMKSGGNVVAIAAAQPQQPSAPQPTPMRQGQPRPVAQRGGGDAESFEGLLAAKVALLADLDRRVARELPKASDESRQKHTDTLFIDVRKTQSDDDLIAWAAQKAGKEMGF